MDRTPELGTEYDWHCPGAGLIRVKVVWHALWQNPHNASFLSGLCRVLIDDQLAWAPISELHEVESLSV